MGTRLSQVVARTKEADICILEDPSQEWLASCREVGCEGGDVLEEAPIRLLRVTQGAFDLHQPSFWNWVAVHGCYELGTLQHLNHGLALAGEFDCNRPSPIIQFQ